MKLKTKILLVALIPTAFLAGTVIWTTGAKSAAVVQEEVWLGLKGNAVALRDAIEMGHDGDYSADDDGTMWKGDFRINDYQTTFDNVRESSGIVLTVCYGNVRMVTGVQNPDGTYATGTKLSDEVTDVVLNQNRDFLGNNVNVNGVKHYAYYLPVYNEEGGDPVGVIFAGQNQKAVEEEINSIIYRIIAVTLLTLVICAVVVILIVTGIGKALQAGVQSVKEVAKGNLKVKISDKDLNRKDEAGELLRELQHLIDSLKNILGDIKKQSKVLDEASDHLNSTAQETNNVVSQVEVAVQEIANGASSQAEETQKASENVVVMGNMVEETTEETDKLNKNAESMRQMSTEANEILKQLLEGSRKSGEGIEEIYNQTLMTNESAKKIKEATDLITSIATETNLLSLNASIEAARAGEQGRGFTVVAAQIQKLAEQSNDSARVIEEIISSLLEDAARSVETMEGVKEVIEEQNRNVKQTGDIFSTVIEGIDQAIQGVSEITGKSRQLDDARVGVVDTVQNLTAIAEENAASTEETSAATTEVASIVSGVSESAKQLREVAENLTRDVEVFQL